MRAPGDLPTAVLLAVTLLVTTSFVLLAVRFSGGAIRDKTVQSSATPTAEPSPSAVAARPLLGAGQRSPTARTTPDPGAQTGFDPAQPMSA